MASLAKAKRPKRPTPRSCLGPVADLEAHLPAEWWRKLFNALYVKTDGDVVENNENTRREVDFIVAAAAIQTHSQILDLCCGQGRHCIELARRGFKNVTGVDRSRYLVRLAKKRAQGEGLPVVFKEGDARNPRLPEASFDCITIMGNSFGYFSNKQDDEKVLTTVGKLLRPSGQLVLDITDGNLSVHARKLEEAGYLTCRKTFENRRPRTDYRLTAAGRQALARYLSHMEAIIRAAKDTLGR